MTARESQDSRTPEGAGDRGCLVSICDSPGARCACRAREVRRSHDPARLDAFLNGHSKRTDARGAVPKCLGGAGRGRAEHLRDEPRRTTTQGDGQAGDSRGKRDPSSREGLRTPPLARSVHATSVRLHRKIGDHGDKCFTFCGPQHVAAKGNRRKPPSACRTGHKGTLQLSPLSFVLCRNLPDFAQEWFHKWC